MKYLNYLLIFILLSSKCFLSLPSQDIWEKTQFYLSYYGLNSLKNYFIYDEKKYTGYNPNSDEMKQLYEKQKNLLEKHGINNYIFLVQYLDETQESIEKAANNLSNKISSYFGINARKSVIALLSINTHSIRIRTGEDIVGNIPDNEAEQIISLLGPYLRSEDYYYACQFLIEKIEYYYTHSYDYCYVFPIIFVAFFIFFIIFIIRYKSHRLPRDDDLIKIVDFLKDLKAEKIIFSDYCIICLNEYIPNKKNSLEDSNDNINSLQIPLGKEPKEVLTLRCGHQYHYECYALWIKSITDCPFCYYKLTHINENENEDKGKIVWETQIVLHPSFKKIKYDNLYTWKFETYSSSNNDYGGDFGGFDGGGGGGGGGGGAGGATGSW